MQVLKGQFKLQLSEHCGDCALASKIFVNVDNIAALFEELQAKHYAFCKPIVESAPWGDRCFSVVGPFSNKILFNE
jgi:hypothetical protein